MVILKFKNTLPAGNCAYVKYYPVSEFISKCRAKPCLGNLQSTYMNVEKSENIRISGCF